MNKLTALLKNKILWIFMFVFLSHGFILLMDGLYGYSWILYNHLFPGDFNGLISLFKETGFVLALPAFFHWGIKLAFGEHFIFGYRLIMFLCIFFSGALLYKLLNKLNIFDDLDNFFIVALFVLYPAFKTAFWIIISIYLLALLCFILGVYLTFSRGRWRWRGVALLSFLLSFSMGAFLPFYFGFLILLFLKSNKKLVNFISQNIDYILLPFLFFAVKLLFWQPFGMHAKYNQLRYLAGPDKILSLFLSYFKWLYYALMPVLDLIKEPIFAVGLCIFVFYIFYLEWQKRRQTGRWSKEFFVVLFGLVLLFLAIFPYAVVGRTADLHFESKNLLLVALPLSLIIAAILEAAVRFNLFSINAKNLILWAMLGMFVISNFQNYLLWQFRWIKDKAVITRVKEIDGAKKYSTFFIINHTNDKIIEELGYNYNCWEWASMFKSIWKEERWAGFDITYGGRIKPSEALEPGCLNSRYSLTRYNPFGSSADLTIDYVHKNIDYSQPAIILKTVSKYFRYKFLNPSHLDEYLKGLIAVKITPNEAD